MNGLELAWICAAYIWGTLVGGYVGWFAHATWLDQKNQSHLRWPSKKKAGP